MGRAITVQVDVKLPSLPNWLLREGDDEPMDVADVADASLREIGEAWVDALIAHAQKRRKDKKNSSSTPLERNA